MISTEETVRDVIVQAIKDIAQKDLGFDAIDGNVRDYLLDHERPENYAGYLMADCDNQKIPAAWGVQVTGTENFYALGETRRRFYNILVEGYRGLGVNGEGIKTLIEHARKVRQAILNLDIHLDQTVTRVLETVQSEPVARESGDVDTGIILVSQFIMSAEKLAEKGELDS